MHLLSWTLLVAAAVGLLALLVQLAAVVTRRRAPPSPPSSWPFISVLKPLCGIEDDLEKNLEAFCRLDYPVYELLLGVRDCNDPAYLIARCLEAEHPQRVRVVVQARSPGLNPKVNQLIGLAAAARAELLVVSDSNTRVDPRYLREIAARFDDPDVGCVTHPVVGEGHQTLGSLLDNLHLSSSVGPGMVAAKRLSGRNLVVGKSMAMCRADLAQLGGFEALKDVLAEDYVFGNQVTQVLGKRVALASTAVVNVSQRRTVGDFIRRYWRWSVIHRTAVQPATYLAQALLNPWPLALLALALSPSPCTLASAGLCLGLKAAIDVAVARSLAGGGRFGLAAFAAVPLKDLLLFVAWVNGLACRTVVWRGNRLRVTAGSRLVPIGLPGWRAPTDDSVTGQVG
jgi:ceramide glucosyltransferase